MKSSFKNTIILLFRSIDKVVFDLYRTGTQWKTRKVPHWVVLFLLLGTYLLILWQLWPFLSATEEPFFLYFGIVMMSMITIVFLIFTKIYISQLLGYKSPYPIRTKKVVMHAGAEPTVPPIRFLQLMYSMDYTGSNLFKNYLLTSETDFNRFVKGKEPDEKIIWLPITDRKLPNFRLFFEFLNHISEENLEGYYGENLLRLCNYIKGTFRSKDTEWTVKQLQKSHSSWKNCNPKRRMDLKIDIENQLLSTGKE
jgi:hypothetical protein